MNTKQLKYVIVLAREGSFSKAAESLGITQPSLSQYVKKIEKEIGLELFDRTGGNLRLTDAGRVYIDAGQKILALERRMEAQFSDLSGNRAGTVVIGASPYRTAGMMPVVARVFRERFPGMHLTIREATTAELAEGLEQGEYDLILTLLPVDERLFTWEKVTEEELILAVPADRPPLPAQSMPQRRYPAVDPAVLNGQSLVMITSAQFMQKQLEELTAEFRLSIGTAAVVKSLEAQINMVRAGVGMALTATGIERFVSEGEVRFYSFTHPLPRRQVVVAWRADRSLSRAADELKKIICKTPL